MMTADRELYFSPINVVTDRRPFYIHAYGHETWESALRDIRDDRPVRVRMDGKAVVVENYADG